MDAALIRNRLQRKTMRASGGTIVLRPRALWSATLRLGDSVTCRSGVVWLTQSGDAQDYLLRAGESFVARGCGRVVAQALEEATLLID